VAKAMGELGVTIFNSMPYYPNEGSNFSDLKEPSARKIKSIRKTAAGYVAQMTHCKRCRADAVGLLDDPLNTHLMDRLRYHATKPIPFPFMSGKVSPPGTPKAPKKQYVAVATREGVLVNQHLGEARELCIYDPSQDVPIMVEKRPLPVPGGQDMRWFGVAKAIADCHTLLVSGVGDNPRTVLNKEGITIFEINGMIDMVLSALKDKQDLSHLMVREMKNTGCQGTGTGCM
jgi:nitrogen fixation protein NifB